MEQQRSVLIQLVGTSNNLKLARFKEIFPGAAKTDRLDARKGLELFQLREHLPLANAVL